MQTMLDSLCRCFGTALPSGDTDLLVATPASATAQQAQEFSPQPSATTPDAKRRTKNMKLQEEQWDALFDCKMAGARNCGIRQSSPAKQVSISTSDFGTVEQAQAVAKAKLAAGERSVPPKRKRASPDDIFRSKKSSEAAENPRTNDAFSRFLTSNPVIANSLCFANPVRDSNEEKDFAHDNNTVVSDCNTLNTAEDTITSTLYYEQVKLAGLKQKNPPMPLFGAYEVKESDDIRKVVAGESYSSLKMKEWMRQNPEMLLVEPHDPLHKLPSNKQFGKDEILPEMVNSSSESTGCSV